MPAKGWLDSERAKGIFIIFYGATLKTERWRKRNVYP